VPVKTPAGSVHVYIRPRDRGLKQPSAKEYLDQKKAVVDRFTVLDHGAKEILRLLATMRIMSAQSITDHLIKYKFPKAENVLADLRRDPVPFVMLSGNDVTLTPILEKIIKEVVAAEQKEFSEANDRMAHDQLRYKITNDPGFAARYNAARRLS